MSGYISHDFDVATFTKCVICRQQTAKYLRRWWWPTTRGDAIAQVHYCGSCKRYRSNEIAQPQIVCPICANRSHSINDILQGYCGHCHNWHENMLKQSIGPTYHYEAG